MAETNTDVAGSDRLGRPVIAGYSLLLAVLVACGLHVAFIAGPAMHRAAHDYLVRTIADEDSHFCETFGLRATGAAFSACSAELAIVRQKQTDRDNAAAQGLL